MNRDSIPSARSAAQASAVLLTAAGVWLAGNLAAKGQGWLYVTKGAKAEPYLAQVDPSLGTKVAGAAPGFGRRLFVHVGDCAGCSASQLSPSKVLVPAGVQVTVMYSGEGCKAPSHLQKLSAGWEGTCDEDGDIRSRLNLYFAPRWFEADRAGHLVWIGKSARDLPAGVRHEG